MEQLLAMLFEFIVYFRVEACMCFWSLGFFDILIPLWSLGLFFNPGIAPVLSLIRSFCSRRALTRISIELGLGVMASRGFIKVLRSVPGMYGSWLWLYSQFVRGEVGDEAFQPLLSFFSSESVISLLKKVPFPLTVKETIFLVFYLVSFLYTVCSLSRMRAEISRGAEETPDPGVHPGVRNPEWCGKWGARELAHRLFSHIQIDFTDLPKVGSYKHLLVIIDHLNYFVEAFPTSRATTPTVVKILLEEIIPRYRLAEVIDSDRGPHFASKIIKEVVTALGTKWQYHTPWYPQSSCKVERVNGKIKKQLTKLMYKTQLSWVKCLPLALLNIRTQPRNDIGISPFEMLYGMPYDIDSPIDHPEISNQQINQYVMKLMKAREGLRRAGLLVQQPPLDLAIHNIKPGDKVLIKNLERNLTNPKLRSPLCCFTHYRVVRNCSQNRREGMDTCKPNKGTDSCCCRRPLENNQPTQGS
nr:uncharacterized protein LOC121470545 [Taeniopygia guttata]